MIHKSHSVSVSPTSKRAITVAVACILIAQLAFIYSMLTTYNKNRPDRTNVIYAYLSSWAISIVLITAAMVRPESTTSHRISNVRLVFSLITAALFTYIILDHNMRDYLYVVVAFWLALLSVFAIGYYRAVHQ